VKAPFPWFGGKRRVADVVWSALGDVDRYVEPFAGSLAVLLERPSSHRGQVEIVNDADAYISNFWRALAADPGGVAQHCDWPVNEADLIARHSWLVNEGRARIERLQADPDWYDVRVAGWWVWGQSAWIGSGWCNGQGPWYPDEGRTALTRDAHDGLSGVVRQRPHLNRPQGVQRRSVADDLPAYLDQLADRLRRVMVCCGDWTRVVTDGALFGAATVGVFLDPPYAGEVRDRGIYATDDHTVSHEVRDWCLAHGDDPRLRIVLAGYDLEHDHLMPDTWRRHRWAGRVSYGTAASAARHRADPTTANRHREVLWMSPHCLPPEQATLFDQGTQR
jgi:hypothetical protein